MQILRLFYYTVERKTDVKTDETRRMALEMYLEGIGLRGIGRLLRISFGTVYQWVKKWGEQIDLTVREESVSIVELDEMHSYVMRKKLQMDFVCGDRTTATGLKLWDKIKNLNVSIFYSDHWKSYNEFVPTEKLIQTKTETYTVEGYNSRITVTIHITSFASVKRIWTWKI